jgi:hypothetical protein
VTADRQHLHRDDVPSSLTILADHCDHFSVLITTRRQPR